MAMMGRLIERLFVQVRADMTGLSTDLLKGARATQRSTSGMVREWKKVALSIDQMALQLKKGMITQGQYTAALNRHTAALAAQGGQYRIAQKQVFGYAASVQQLSRVNMRRVFNPGPINTFARSTGMARMQMLNLGYQINDVATGLATGIQNPMTILAQQGSQMIQIYAGQGGVRMALRDIGFMMSKLVSKAWPLLLVVGAFKLMQIEINKTSTVMVGFLDTLKAGFQVAGRSIWSYIGGPLKSLGIMSMDVIDRMIRTWKKWTNIHINSVVFVVKAIGIAWNLLPDLFYDVMITIKNTAIDAIEFIGNLFVVTLVEKTMIAVNKIIQLWVFTGKAMSLIFKAVPAIVGDAMTAANNLVLTGIELMVNGALDALRKLFGFLDKLPPKMKDAMGITGFLGGSGGIDLSQYKQDLSGALDTLMADLATEATATFNKIFIGGFTLPQALDLSGQKGATRGAFAELGRAMAEAMEDAFSKDYLGDYFESVKTQAIANALARVADGLQEAGAAAKQAADEVEELMKKLGEGLDAAAKNLASVFGDAFTRLAETGKFVFKDFITDINALIIRSTSVLLQEELMNMFKTLATARGGLGSTLANIFTGLFSGGAKMGARSHGGVEMPWRSFVAGENGAELITQDGPAGARRVSTAGRTQGAMGYGQKPMSVTFNIQTPDVAGFRQSQGQIASKMARFMGSARRNQ